METGSEKPDSNKFSEKDISVKETKQSESKDEEKKQTQNSKKKDEVNQEHLRLRLRIQRMKEEDFFVSIGGRDLIIKLKAEIFRLLEPEKSSESSAANLRLIYKGKVLADAKLVESYKIQNEDTIQLVPFNQPSRRSDNAEDKDNVSEAKAEEEQSGNTETSAQDRGERTSGRPITLISFSTSIIEGSRRSQGSQSSQATPTRSIRQLRRLITSPAQSTSPRPWSPSRTMNNASIRSLRNHLQNTLTQVCAFEQLRAQQNATEIAGETKDSEKKLLKQLDTLLSTATMLREDIQAEAVIQATGGVFPLVTRQEDDRAPRERRSNSSQRAPEQKDSSTGQETKKSSAEQKSEPASTAAVTEEASISAQPVKLPCLDLTLNDSITIAEQTSSFELRYRRLELLPHLVFSFLKVKDLPSSILAKTPSV